MSATKQSSLAVLLLLILIGSITIGLQSWVGDSTIYSVEKESKREIMHNAILTNTPPPGGSWSAIGAAACNIRIGAVYLAEGIRSASGLPLRLVYKLIDTVFLFCALIGLFFYLRKWFPDTYCLIGILYFSAMLPLTYFMYIFHPWDRIQLTAWILLLYLVRERKLLLFGLFLALSIVIKLDTILLPGLYFLVYVSRQHWKRVMVETLILFIIAFGVYFELKYLFPEPSTEPARFGFEGVLRQIPSNIRDLIFMKMHYPPLLVYAVPALLAISGLRNWLNDRFISASVFFSIGLMVIWFVFTNFAEFRAQTVVLVLVLPGVLLSLQKLIDITEL